MRRGAFYFRLDAFAGPAEGLAEVLAPLDIKVRRIQDDFPCHEYLDGEGRKVREIGQVVAYEDGRIRVYPGNDATDAEQVTLLRTAERVTTHGFDGPDEPGWSRGKTTSGRLFRRCTVLTFPDDSSQEAAESAAAAQAVDELLAQLGLLEGAPVGAQETDTRGGHLAPTLVFAHQAIGRTHRHV